MAEVTIEQIADAMYELVKSTHGKKNLKPMDVTKAMIDEFGEDDVDKRMCKKALRSLIDATDSVPVSYPHNRNHPH